MTGFLEDGLLRMEGLDDQDIADLNSALPALSLAIGSVESVWPKIAPRIPALLRIIQKIIAKQKELNNA